MKFFSFLKIKAIKVLCQNSAVSSYFGVTKEVIYRDNAMPRIWNSILCSTVSYVLCSLLTLRKWFITLFINKYFVFVILIMINLDTIRKCSNLITYRYLLVNLIEAYTVDKTFSKKKHGARFFNLLGNHNFYFIAYLNKCIQSY